MAEKVINCSSGTVEVSDDYGLRIRITDVDGAKHAMVLWPGEMRKLAAALNAFAEIYSS